MKSLSFFDFARDVNVDFARDTVYHEMSWGSMRQSFYCI